MSNKGASGKGLQVKAHVHKDEYQPALSKKHCWMGLSLTLN